MTTRDYLALQKRRCFIGLYGGFIMFAGCAVLSAGRTTMIVVAGALAGGLGFVSMMYLSFGIRCPSCGERLGAIVAYVGTPFTIPRKLRCCPFCAFELDTPMDDQRRGG